MEKQITRTGERVETQKTELADAHCHLDMMKDWELVKKSIDSGVLTLITNGVDNRTNKKTLELCDKRNIFGAIGIDPENALKLEEEDLDEEVEKVAKMVKDNMDKVVAIGEIGLDYTKAGTFELVGKQKTVFERMLDIATKFDLPVCVHSRNAMDDVLATLEAREMQKVQLHFFEGNVQQAMKAVRSGYMISMPSIDSTKRRQVIKDVPLDKLLCESDSPAAGESPKDVEKVARLVAEIKGLTYERASEALTLNTKRFFNIQTKLGFMRN